MAVASSLFPLPSVSPCPSHRLCPPLAALPFPATLAATVSSRRLTLVSDGLSGMAAADESAGALAADAFSSVKHVLLPVTDRNPFLSEGTKQAAATTASLAKKYGADITVVVIDEKPRESIPEHDTQLSSIQWHLSEGGFSEFKLMERLGEGKLPTAIIGEIADEMNQDLVILSMEAIHSKHVDANLLVEFIPCPVLLLPL